MNKILPIILVVVLSGCAATTSGSFQLMSSKKMKVFSFPSLGVETTKSIGDSLVDLAYRKVGKGLTLNDIVTDEWAYGIPPTVGVRIEPGTAFLSARDNSNTCYGMFSGVMIDTFLSLSYNSPMHICVRDKPLAGETKLYFISTGGIFTKRDFKASYKKIKDLKAPIQDNSFQQQFIYNGKIDNAIKFIYREFEGGMNRSTFQQELQYDLNESNVVGFKEMRLEIIEATNQSIRYKVIKNFSLKMYE